MWGSKQDKRRPTLCRLARFGTRDPLSGRKTLAGCGHARDVRPASSAGELRADGERAVLAACLRVGSSQNGELPRIGGLLSDFL